MAQTPSPYDLRGALGASGVLLRANQRWLEGCLLLQSALWSTCIEMQTQWARPFAAGGLPSWMVWTEQLA